MTTTAEPPLGQYEERLLAELKEFVGSRPDIAPRVSSPPRRRRVLQAATAVGASAAVAAGLLIATARGPATTPAAGYSLDAFLTAAATAARAQQAPLPAPDQAFYDKQLARFPGENTGRCVLQWSPHPLTGVGERVTEFDAAGGCPSYLVGRTILILIERARPNSIKYHLYPALYSLPVRAVPLWSALYAAAARGPAYWNLPRAYTADQVVFTLAGRLLEGPVSGSLRAALFEIIGQLPGVRLIQDATDAIGRHGTGIEMHGLPDKPGAPWTIELVIASHTYQFLGMSYGAVGSLTRYASIGTGLVTVPRR